MLYSNNMLVILAGDAQPMRARIWWLLTNHMSWIWHRYVSVSLLWFEWWIVCVVTLASTFYLKYSWHDDDKHWAHSCVTRLRVGVFAMIISRSLIVQLPMILRSHRVLWIWILFHYWKQAASGTILYHQVFYELTFYPFSCKEAKSTMYSTLELLNFRLKYFRSFYLVIRQSVFNDIHRIFKKNSRFLPKYWGDKRVQRERFRRRWRTLRY